MAVSITLAWPLRPSPTRVHPGGSIQGPELGSGVGLFLEASKPPGQTSNPLTLEPGAEPRASLGIGRPGLSFPAGKVWARGARIYLPAFPEPLSFLALFAFRRWRPKVALLKQSLLASVRSIRASQREAPEMHLDLGNPQDYCSRFKKKKKGWGERNPGLVTYAHHACTRKPRQGDYYEFKACSGL